jgi:uncharacterized protein (DUF1015 family)
MGIPELPVPDGLVMRPFRGVRFAVDDPAKVTSPPYDLISDGDVRSLLDSHPNNVVRLILPGSSAAQSTGTHTTPPGTRPSPGEPANAAERESASPPPESASHTAHRTSPEPSTGMTDSGPARSAEPGSESPSPESPSHGAHHTSAGDAGGSPDVAHRASAGDLAHPAHPAQPASGNAPADISQNAPGSSPAESQYSEARDTLRTWLDTGVLVPDELPALYVYEQRGPNVLQRGLIGDVSLADPARHIILPHEDVFPGPIADRLALMSTTQANLEPIFLLYDGGQGTATRLVDEVAATRQPLVTARTDDGLTHHLWAITDQAEIDAINADLHPRQALIADGHHRYATYRVLQRQEHAARDIQAPAHPQTPEAPQAPQTPEAPPQAPQGPQAAPASPQVPPKPQASSPVTSPAPMQHTASGLPIASPETHTPPATSVTQPPHDSAERTSGRQAASPSAGPWDFGLALLVDSRAYPPDLKAIHRVILGLPLSEAIARAKGSWRVQDHANLSDGMAALAAAAEPAFLLAGEGDITHLLTNPDPVQLAHAMPGERSDRWNALNTAVLTEFVLPKVWGMQDNEQDVRIVHHDPVAAVQLAVRSEGTAVILKPLAIADVLAIAAEGERVPRKSTSFGPKPRTGLVLRTFAID